ncbi:MAG: molybdopterin molybdotransferase MoeA [Mycobacteriales bacterium]
MTSWPEAHRIAHGAGVPVASVTVPLEGAAGRTLAADVASLHRLPHFDAAAMDGWAVRGPGPWRWVGQVLAGDPPPGELRDGEAVEIATGAVVPAGCEGVLPYEQGRVVGEGVEGPHPQGRHVRHAGEECGAGEVLLHKGSALTAAALGLAAAVGHDHLPVRRDVRVRCLVTGSELVREGVPSAGQVRDAVGPLLRPALLAAGARLVEVQHLVDEAAVLKAALADTAADPAPDLVVTSGASSRGPADHLARVLQDLGAQVLVDGVLVKPGHPQLLAVLPDGRPVVGLPGNPLAALCAVVTLVQPLVAGLLGRPCPEPVRGRLAEPVAGHPSSYRLVPVRLEDGKAVPTGHGGAAMLRGAAVATHLAAVGPEGGSEVGLLALP